jgi:hypothetical protein
MRKPAMHTTAGKLHRKLGGEERAAGARGERVRAQAASRTPGTAARRPAAAPPPPPVPRSLK